MTTKQPKPVIGLVGGIGSGKSEVARILVSTGCVVCDSDALSHKCLQDPVVQGELQKWWGSGVIGEGG